MHAPDSHRQPMDHLIEFPDLVQPLHIHSGQIWLNPHDKEFYLLQAITLADGSVGYGLFAVVEDTNCPEHSLLVMVSTDGKYTPQPLFYFEAFFQKYGWIQTDSLRLGFIAGRTYHLPPEQQSLLHALANDLTHCRDDADTGYEQIHPGVMLGRELALKAYTLCSMARLRNVWTLVDTLYTRGLAGDFAELGVWRGGMAIWMKALIQAYEAKVDNTFERQVWVCDSFNGFHPEGTTYDTKDERYDTLVDKPIYRVSANTVRENFRHYALLDDRVRFVEGYFEDTLKDAPIGSLALLRLDADVYNATYASLMHLYPKLAVGGYCIVDDYLNVPSCAKAVNDYFGDHLPSLHRVDWTCVFWQKQETHG